MGNDSSYYDEDGWLFMSTRKDTVIFEDSPYLVFPIIKVIRKDANDTYRTSFYQLDREGLPRLFWQFVYNRNYDILAIKEHRSRYTKQK